MHERHRRVVRDRGVVRRVPGAGTRIERVQLVVVRRDDLLEADARHPLGRGLVRPEHRVDPSSLQVQDGDAVHGRRLGGQVLDHEELTVVGREGLGLEVPSQVVGPWLSAPGRVGHDDRRPRTRQRDLRVPAVGERIDQRDRRRRSPRPPERRACRPAGRRRRTRRPRRRRSRAAWNRPRAWPRAATSRRGSPRSAGDRTAPTRSGPGPRAVRPGSPRSRVSRGTGRSAASSGAPCVHAATPRAATDSATISFLSICDLPFGPDRASDVSSAPPSTQLPPWWPDGSREPGDATGGSARWVEPERGGAACADVDGSASRCSSGRRSRAPRSAWADGGAYLDLDRTHYLPGQTARVEGYVSIPRAKQDLIERGPFYVFVVPPRTAVTEGRPIPAEAVRAGTVSIERDRGTIFELHGVVRRPRARRRARTGSRSATTPARSRASANP